MRFFLKTAFLLLALCLGGKSFAQVPRLKFQTEIQPFDTLIEGANKTYEFVFKNTSTAPLTLEAFTACGCTVASVPATAVLPGTEDRVSITYHTYGRQGPFEQTILLRAAAAGESLAQQDEYLLKIRGLVRPATTR